MTTDRNLVIAKPGGLTADLRGWPLIGKEKTYHGKTKLTTD